MATTFECIANTVFGLFIYVLSIFIYERCIRDDWNTIRELISKLYATRNKLRIINSQEQIALSPFEAYQLTITMKQLRLLRMKFTLLKICTFLSLCIALKASSIQILFEKTFPHKEMQSSSLVSFLPFYCSLIDFFSNNVEVLIALISITVITKLKKYSQRKKVYSFIGTLMLVSVLFSIIPERSITHLYSYKSNFSSLFTSSSSPLSSSQPVHNATISTNLTYKNEDNTNNQSAPITLKYDENLKFKVGFISLLSLFLFVSYVFYQQEVEGITIILICIGLLELLRYLLNCLHKGVGNTFCGLLISVAAEYFIHFDLN